MFKKLQKKTTVCVSLYLCLTCRVDASRGQGALEGRDLRHFLSLQLCDCFLFHWSWGGCFGEGGRENVLAFLDTLKNTHAQGLVWEHRERRDVLRVLREKQTSRLWSLALWEISPGWWEHSKHKLMDRIADYTEQTAITNQLPVVLKDKFAFKGPE